MVFVGVQFGQHNFRRSEDERISIYLIIERDCTYERLPAKAPPTLRNIIIIPYVLLNPKLAVAKDMPTTPYMTTGLRPKRSEAYVQGKTRASDQRGYSFERHGSVLDTRPRTANKDSMSPE